MLAAVPFAMSTIWAIILLVGGLVILWKCAEFLVTGAVGLAKRLGVSTLIIGLTVVAMGTSAPEVAASIAAALRGVGDVAVGNVYGSNIANLALVGGLCALIRPIVIKKQTLRYQMPAMLLVALLLWPVLTNLYLSRVEGVMLLGVFATLILLTICAARREGGYEPRVMTGTSDDVGKTNKPAALKAIVSVVIGLAGLAFGADITVRGAIYIGEQVGLSKAVIGLTIIAIGTSLPELVTCLVASLKGQDDLSIGNLVGSNIFNTLLVTGIAGSVRPFAIGPRLAGVDYWVMITVGIAFSVLALIGRRSIGRASGAILLLGYFGYMTYLLAYTAGT